MFVYCLYGLFGFVWILFGGVFVWLSVDGCCLLFVYELKILVLVLCWFVVIVRMIVVCLFYLFCLLLFCCLLVYWFGIGADVAC